MPAYTTATAFSKNCPFGSPFSSKAKLPPATCGVSFVMPNASSAFEFTTQMCPHARVMQIGCSVETESKSHRVGKRRSSAK